MLGYRSLLRAKPPIAANQTLTLYVGSSESETLPNPLYRRMIGHQDRSHVVEQFFVHQCSPLLFAAGVQEFRESLTYEERQRVAETSIGYDLGQQTIEALGSHPDISGAPALEGFHGARTLRLGILNSVGLDAHSSACGSTAAVPSPDRRTGTRRGGPQPSHQPTTRREPRTALARLARQRS